MKRVQWNTQRCFDHPSQFQCGQRCQHFLIEISLLAYYIFLAYSYCKVWVFCCTLPTQKEYRVSSQSTRTLALVSRTCPSPMSRFCYASVIFHHWRKCFSAVIFCCMWKNAAGRESHGPSLVLRNFAPAARKAANTIASEHFLEHERNNGLTFYL